jgi:hypothetical protein
MNPAVLASDVKKAIRAIGTAVSWPRHGLTWLYVAFFRDPALCGASSSSIGVCFEAASKAGTLQHRSNPEIYARANLANFRRRQIAPSAPRPDSRSGRAAGSGTGVNAALPDP